MIGINSFLVAYVGVYLFSSIADVVIDLINESHLKRSGGIIPEGFEGIIDEEKLKQMDEYTIDKSRFSIFRAIVGKCVFLVIILSGLLPWAAGILEGFNFIPAGLIFFAIPGLIGALADLPFGYYHIFRIEGQYGFNTISIRAWVCDLLKSLVIGVILGAILLSLLLLMVRFTGSMWWLWAWLIFIAFQLLITIVYPILIAPVFNKFTPIQNDELAGKIRGLADREGLTVKGIFQMDAGRRSRHTNAYFSGLGRAKRIVLYDTLLESHEQDEIMAVLAHEIGHLRKGHIKKQLAIMGIA
ncbi:MAG: M48 family metallopeptidase, partial [Deltaproteobacteria bacterium]|nr:M48 family metallopeptidase [Deltaproteobacteria bacterium]